MNEHERLLAVSRASMGSDGPDDGWESKLEFRIVKLTRPLFFEGKLHDELRIREPVLKFMVQMDRGDGETDRKLRLVAACADIPYYAAERMCAPDFVACVEAVEGLYPKPFPGPESAESGKSASS